MNKKILHVVAFIVAVILSSMGLNWALDHGLGYDENVGDVTTSTGDNSVRIDIILGNNNDC
jgi:hypothetical protein